MRTALLSLLLLMLAAPAAAQESKNVRTLDAITIEGEIDLPQVLFITARDQHRFRDRVHRNYLKSCAEVGSTSTLPRRVKPVSKEK